MTSRTSTPVPRSDGALAEDADAAALLRAVDWSQTPLGPLDTWPADLREVVAQGFGRAFEQGRAFAGRELEQDRLALRQTREQLEFALHAARLGSWEFDIASQTFTSTAYSRENFG